MLFRSQAGEDVGEADQVEVVEQELEDQVHGPQQEPVKLPVDHPVTQEPGL